jgi:hypothetical protein
LIHGLNDAKSANDEEESFLSSLGGDGDDIFASLGANDHNNSQSTASGSGPSASMSDPSPGSLLGNYSHMGDPTASGHASNLPGEEGSSYDLDSLDLTDLGSGFNFGDAQSQNSDMGFNMEELLSMGGGDQMPDPDSNIQVKMEP